MPPVDFHWRAAPSRPSSVVSDQEIREALATATSTVHAHQLWKSLKRIQQSEDLPKILTRDPYDLYLDGYLEFAANGPPGISAMTPTPPSTDEPKTPILSPTQSRNAKESRWKISIPRHDFGYRVLKGQSSHSRRQRRTRKDPTFLHRMLRRSRAVEDDMFYELDHSGRKMVLRQGLPGEAKKSVDQH